MTRIDVNCDVGEGCGADDELFPLITSANIACGAHAGGPEIIGASVRAAMAAGVAIGAHPGFADREHFGRRPQPLAPHDVDALVGPQIRLVRAIAEAEGATLTHVKPHGALYNMAAADAALADAMARVVRDVDARLILVGLAGSELIRAGERAGLPTASEAFADWRYFADGSLVPRGRADAVIADISAAVDQAMSLVRDAQVLAVDGHTVRVRADTICVHGDEANAVALARALRAAFTAMGIRVAPLGRREGHA